MLKQSVGMKLLNNENGTEKNLRKERRSNLTSVSVTELLVPAPKIQAPDGCIENPMLSV
jgi:hypothetical protein